MFEEEGKDQLKLSFEIKPGIRVVVILTLHRLHYPP